MLEYNKLMNSNIIFIPYYYRAAKFDMLRIN